MCGITGAVSLSGRPLRTRDLKATVDIVAHRGPDDAGYLLWQTGRKLSQRQSYGQSFTDTTFHHLNPLLPVWDSHAGEEMVGGDSWDIFLGHRRLSIIDLSSRGHQPMGNKTKNIWVVFNGEIYNFKSLRSELETRGYDFASNSDTEVLIYAYQEWGIRFIERLNGMFALCLFDVRGSKLFLARDRYGVKPLYYTVEDGDLLFGSEIKSILAYKEQRPDVDLAALNEYFSFQNILTDRTLFSDVKMLPAGHFLQYDLSAADSGTLVQYWDFDFSRESSLSESEIEDQLYELVVQAVKQQTVSDVPIGSYLSGGMDSGAVTALLAKEFGRINTFTMGFDLSDAAQHEMSFDERELAEQMANLFQTEHYECVLHSGDMEAVIEKLVWHLEDLRIGQCYPNYYISRLASHFVKVVMSGAGGDELFGGYPWRYAAAVATSQEGYAENYYKYWQRLVSNTEKRQLFTPDVVAALEKTEVAEGVPFKDHTLNVFKGVFPTDVSYHDRESQVNNSLYFEAKTFLHGLLVVEDKISMAHSLETRVPYLNNDLVDFALKVPVKYKIRNLNILKSFDENTPRKHRLYQQQTNVGKSVLRNTMKRILPDSIHEAKKQGFSAPDESWFRGKSADYVRDLLLSSDSRINGFLNQNYVRQVIEHHAEGKTNKRLLIWSFLSFEWWLRCFS